MRKLRPNHHPNKRPIWIHTSSGEFEYAKPLIRKLKEQNPKCLILVTYFSPTYKKNIESFKEVDFAVPSPFDTPSEVRKFLDYFNPAILLISRTDLWPEMLTQTRNRGIP
ncbi:MAG: hypothetical protein KDD25_07155, partial [Bdellovibrionales bacterium]|nr:hypothetical protein [Bdellovibrionales bacterium]